MERRRVGQVSRKIFEVLLANPNGMNTYSLVRSLEASLPAPTGDSGPSTKGWLETLVRIGISAPAQAGWVLNNDGLWTISASGRKAYAATADPERFIDEAAKRSTKGWLSVRFPRLYLAASRAKYQVGVEYGLIKRVGAGRVLAAALRGSQGKTAHWSEALPVQQPRVVDLDGFDSSAQMLDQFRAAGLACSKIDATDLVYIGPDQPWRKMLLKNTVICPENTALVVSNSGIREGGPGNSFGEWTAQTLCANLLSQIGLGARVYDTFSLRLGDRLFPAYAVEHVEGRRPLTVELKAAVSQVRNSRLGSAIEANVSAMRDFRPDSAVGTPDGRVVWKAFQDFKLADYGRFLRKTAVEASTVSHWGDRSILRGWKYLYQSVPGVALPARRDCARRMNSIESLMKEAGVSISGKLVLDIGTNMGMMMAQYLSKGAGWCYGWDTTSMTPHTEKLLLALGCTRFSVTGRDLSRHSEIEEDLPAFLSPLLDGCVISYLAVRGPLGWLDSLARIPWSFMIYEGHEEETERDLDRFLAELNEMVPVRISALGQVQDGDSEPRTLAIVTRS